MLWWVTHQKKESVSELEIWYLGANVVKSVQIPNETEMNKMEKDLESLWHEIKSKKTSIENCHANPSPLRGLKILH